MNMKRLCTAAATSICLLVLLIGCVPVIRAEHPDDLMPAESAAKAKSILTQAIAGLGGDAYLHVRKSECTGRFAQFEHSGAVGGFVQFHEYREMPDKLRNEYGKNGVVVDLYAGDKGWTLDRGGVSEVPATVMADFQEQSKTDLNTILRFRLNDDTLVFRYSGSDVVDLKEADWVEIADREGHTIRAAIDKKTHLPIRSTVTKRDPETGDRITRAAYFTNYHVIDGIQTPYQLSRFRNDLQVFQSFYDKCQYNGSLPPDLFTRASLDASFGKNRKNTKTDKK
jgi:hypothetical protein